MKKAFFRFYEELNDFLPPEKVKTEFSHEFNGIVSVKDMIQSFRVPHTEVDMILVNRKSVGFDYIVSDGDRISVYPVFESFDIQQVQKLRPRPLRNPKFILDVHLGKLTRLMRMIGLDTLYRNLLDDEEIVEISIDERRTILTRDIGILKRNKAEHGYWIRNTDPNKQIIEVINRFQLKENIKAFSRCISCNSGLVEIAKEDYSEQIPEKVFKYYEKYYRCEGCGKIYWKGSHYDGMLKILDQIKSKLH